MTEIIDGSVEFKIKNSIKRPHHALGEIVTMFCEPEEWEHLLFCDGSSFEPETYPGLYNKLGTNVLPNLNSRFLQGGTTAGNYIEAGLPNITGAFELTVSNYVRAYGGSGAFWVDSNENYKTNTTASGNTQNYPYSTKFDASRSNTIYGKSTTVQPPACTVMFYICYGD